MLKYRAIFAIGATFLFLAVAMIPTSVGMLNHKDYCDLEFETVTSKLNELMDKIDAAKSYVEVFNIIKDSFDSKVLISFPILTEILSLILSWTLSSRNLFLGNLLNRDGLQRISNEKFVISFGSYKKLNPIQKEEKLSIFKQGFAYWRFDGKAKLFSGRTLIADRKPFTVKQRIQGKQIGVLIGFSGLFVDFESKITGNSYVFIMGNARRARAFDLTPFSD